MKVPVLKSSSPQFPFSSFSSSSPSCHGCHLKVWGPFMSADSFCATANRFPGRKYLFIRRIQVSLLKIVFYSLTLFVPVIRDDLVAHDTTDRDGRFAIRGSDSNLVRNWTFFSAKCLFQLMKPTFYVYIENWCNEVNTASFLNCAYTIKVPIPDSFVSEGNLPKSVSLRIRVPFVICWFPDFRSRSTRPENGDHWRDWNRSPRLLPDTAHGLQGQRLIKLINECLMIHLTVIVMYFQ